MKKLEMADALRSEYKRSDFGEIIRGKYADRITEIDWQQNLSQTTRQNKQKPEMAHRFEPNPQ